MSIESRPLRPSPYGKCTMVLELTLPEEVHDALVSAASIAGQNKAHYAREALETHLFGHFGRLQRIVGARGDGDNGANSGT